MISDLKIEFIHKISILFEKQGKKERLDFSLSLFLSLFRSEHWYSD